MAHLYYQNSIKKLYVIYFVYSKNIRIFAQTKPYNYTIMKKIISNLLLVCLFLSGASTMCMASDVKLSKKNPIHKAPSRQPQTTRDLLAASIDDQVISFSSLVDMDNVNVIVVSADGTTVLSENLSLMAGLNYNLAASDLENGEYSILFICGTTTYQGDFAIE